MKFMLGSVLLAAGLMTQSAPASATVPVSCAPGMLPVQSEGIQISGGVIELLDNACQPQGGTELPPPLHVTNTAATPGSVNAGQSTTYTATVAGFITQPVPNITYDECFLDVVRPGGQLQQSIAIPALSALVSIPVTIPTDAVSGGWLLNMRCKRFVSNQEIVLPSIPGAALQVISSTAPGGCTNLPAPFMQGAVNTYVSHYNATFGEAHNWVWNQIGNVYNYNPANQSYGLLGVRVRAFSFVAPAAGREAKINFPSPTAGITASISSQCGDFTVPQRCIGVASTAITWSTNASPQSFKCPLVPGQTYYLNFAWFDYAAYAANGTVTSTCVCPGPTCNGTSGTQYETSCQAGNNSTAQ